MRSGYVNIGNGRLRGSNVVGYGWTLTASAMHYNGSILPSAYYLRFDATGFSPSAGPDGRQYGYSLRCLGEGSALG